MTNALARKLGSFADLSDSDRAAIDSLCAHRVRLDARYVLLREGDRPEDVHLLLEGWACRYKLMPDGGRQIMAYLIPGDVCDVHAFILKTMDHNISLLGPATVASIPKEAILDIMTRHPRIERALWWSTLVDEAVLREWLVNIGQREALERVAHLFCELWLRMRAVGLAEDGSFSLPLTQEDLGDTVGLTSVHVNRTLQRLRADGLITLAKKHLTIHDPQRLAGIAQFRSNYLHFDRRLAHAGMNGI